MVIIDQLIQDEPQANATFNYPVNITSQDAILFVSIVYGAAAGSVTVNFNGNSLTQISSANGGLIEQYDAYVMLNPSVGMGNLQVIISTGAFAEVNILSLLGASKVTSSYQTVVGSTVRTVFPNVPPGSLIINGIGGNADLGVPTNPGQYRFFYDTTNPNGMSAGYGSGNVILEWSSPGGSVTFENIAYAIPPAQAPSIWIPNITTRNPFDVLQANDLDQFNYVGATNVRIFGRYPLQLWQNSFLHTVGRLGNPQFQSPPSTVVGSNIQSGIIIDNILKYGISALATGNAISFNIPSPDSVLLVFISVNNNSDVDRCFYNGVQLNSINKITNSSGQINVYYTLTPAVGNNDLNFVFGSGSQVTSLIALSILGVDKKTTNLNTITTSNAGASISTAITVPTANSLIIDAINFSTGNPVNIEQNVLAREGGAALLGLSFRYGYGQIAMGWNANTGIMQAIVVLEPASAPSLYHPNISFRNATDSSSVNNFNNSTSALGMVYSKPYPSTFYQNSFLHTIGRLGQSNPIVGTVTSETEQETSQIIIDKVFQGQVAAQALSTVTLNMDVSIPSPDAILVVTGGSVIATGASWANVQFNGNNLTRLVQTGVANQSAEIWYYPYPTVGVGVLTVTSGTGGEIYANAMVILGVDKRSTNITTASNTDAASTATIGALITPDAPNSLVIDTIATLNATTFPTADSSQTQVFNASALVGNEYVLTTYKLASQQTNMNYNLSVAVNASMVAVSFRPAYAPSMWFPNIDFREIDDTVTVTGLDAEVNPAFGQYGYKPSMFYLNSFLHTIGRYPRSVTQVVQSTGSNLLLMGVG